MSLDNLPVEWYSSYLLDICNVKTGKVDANHAEKNGLYNFFTCALEPLRANTYSFDGNLIILPGNGANVGHVEYFRGKIEAYQRTYVLHDFEQVNSKYVFYHLKYLWKKSNLDKQYGSATNYIKIGNFQNYTIEISPLAEQQEIVRQLDIMLAQVEQIKARLDAIPAILKKFRQSVLADAVSGKLTEEWRQLKNIEPVAHTDIQKARLETFVNEEQRHSLKKGLVISEQKILSRYKPAEIVIQDEFNLTLMNQVPENWTITNLDNVSIIVTGKTPSTTDEANWNGKIPFISPSQILENGDLIKPERYVSNLGIQKVPFIPKGSILIVCIGTIGKVGLLKEDVAFNQQLNALIPTAIVRKEFLFMWCKTLHSWLNKTSSAVVNAAIINKSKLSMAPCPVPTIEEQNEIINIVTKLLGYADKVEATVQSAQKRVNLLTQSILAKAFSGELTAEWREQHQELITGINSVESLLAKIQAEREASKPVKKLKKAKAV